MKLKWRKKYKDIDLKKDIYIKDKEWKEKDQKYLRELQIFFDIVDSIEDNELRKSIINQMLICDDILTKIAEKNFSYFYDEGYRKAKKG